MSMIHTRSSNVDGKREKRQRHQAALPGRSKTRCGYERHPFFPPPTSAIAMSMLNSLVRGSAYLGVPLYVLHKASEASPIARYYVRQGLYLSTLGLCSAWGICVAAGMSLVGRQIDVNYVVGRLFHFCAGRALGISFEIEGEEYIKHAGAAVMVGNHQSMLDIMYLGRYVYSYACC
jgi:hypothetical protein